MFSSLAKIKYNEMESTNNIRLLGVLGPNIYIIKIEKENALESNMSY